MIPIAKPLVGEREASAAQETILSGWLSQGKQVAGFEEEFAASVGAEHACAVSNCTTALHLALLAVGVQPGDEVITVSHSFIAAANVVRQCGATPIFVDVGKHYNMDPERAAAAITSRTRAILCVHQIGMPCDLGALVALARDNKIALVEDAACAIGSEIHLGGAWSRIGSGHGDIACFSLHPRKVITTGEGGMLTTNNCEWDSNLRRLRQHGMSVSDAVRHSSDRIIFEEYTVPGYNYRMTDVQAAIGVQQLKRLPSIVERRRALAARYHALLSGIDGVQAPAEPRWARSNWQSYCVGLDDHVDQRDLMQRLLDLGVATRRGVMCAHMEPAYADMEQRHCLKRSERARDRTILLPLFAQMTEAEQDAVVAALDEALDHARAAAPMQVAGA